MQVFGFSKWISGVLCLLWSVLVVVERNMALENSFIGVSKDPGLHRKVGLFGNKAVQKAEFEAKARFESDSLKSQIKTLLQM